MSRPLQKGSLRIATIAGIPIWVHFSWLIIFGLITWSLASRFFPKAAPDLPVHAYWIKGVLAALLLFSSVVVHELSHSLVAQRYGVGIESITMFVFGDLKTVSPGMSIKQAVDEHFLRYGYGGFPVIEAGKFLGIITLKEVKNIPKEDWGRLTVSDVYVPHDKKWEVTIADDILRALELMIKEDKGRVVVKDKGGLAGLITRNGIARYVQIKGK